MFDSGITERRLGQLDEKLNQKQQVRLKTCADVYDYWRTCKRHYRKAPKDGVEFQIDYIDTGFALPEESRSKAPIALALHGAPGSYHDFTLLINHLSRQKVRVIAPNFPEYTATVKTKVLFRHSADEKAAYLRDFLKAININKIDLLVSHSSAIFPTLLILLNANKKPKVLVTDSKSEHKLAEELNEKLTFDNTTEEETKSKISDIKGEPEIGESSSTEDEKFEDARDKLSLDGNNNIHLTVSNQPGLVQQQNDGETTGQKLQNEQQEQPESVLDEDLNEVGDQQIKGKKKKSRKSKQKLIVKFEDRIEIKAVALFNPAGHRLPKSMKPTWFKCGSVRVYQHKVGRYWFRKLGPAFLTVVGVPVRVDNMDNVMLSATVMRNSRCERVESQLEQLSKLKLPTLLVFSENDKLIEREIFYEMTQFMNLDPKHFDTFDNDGEVDRTQSRKDDWIRVMVFKAGGHYAYSNYAKTVNKAVSELLDKVIGTSRHSSQDQSD